MSLAPDGAEPHRLGFFGGTFDPPHVGHVQVATDVADALRLDRLLWMPAGVPPHKEHSLVSSADVRLEMTCAAADVDSRFVASDLEVRRDGPSFTVDTLRSLAADHREARLFLVLGADQVRTFETLWKSPTEILRLATLAIMDRDGEDARTVAPLLPGMERSIHVPVTRVDVSSTRIRALVARGSDISGLVPAAVAGIIRREGLYRL
jgi:nicotinate-nucleotide adenylyltransferase